MRSLRLLLVLLPWSALGQEGKAPKKAEKPTPGVSWQGQVVMATGSGAPDMKAANPAQARLGAERAAQLDAFRNLLEQVKGVHVSAGKTVGEAMAKDEVRGKVEGVIRGFKVTGKRYFTDSGVELDVEVPLAAIAEAIVQPAPAAEAIGLKTDGERKNTGLVVDARGLKVVPALGPRLIDESGKQLYGPETVAPDARKQSGVAVYASSLDEAKRSTRAGEKPLVIKAAKAEGSDLIVPAGEVKRVLEANSSYLAEGRVVIVM
ncbi:MAG: hypothetical protein HYZ28_08865 [Myxococcales bacterium]|nr:hypothetical protein [Myxococcales bacterium]